MVYDEIPYYEIQIFEDVKDFLDKITHAEYKISKRLLELDEDILYNKYQEKVAKVLFRKADIITLKELWQFDDLSRFFIYIYHNPNRVFEVSGERFFEAFDIVGENLLDQRFRGIYHLARNEGFIESYQEGYFLSYKEIKEMVKDERFASKYPLTHLLFKKIFEIMTNIKEKYQTELNYFLGEVIKTSEYGEYNVERFYPTVSCYGKPYDEDMVEDIIKKIMAMKEFWEKWIKVREEIVHSFGIEDEAFMIRDLLEGILGLPLWTIMVKPATDGWDLVMDIKYADVRREKLKLSLKQWYDIFKLIKAEFRRTNGKPIFRIYSPPIPLGMLLGRVIGPNVIKKITEILYAEKKDIISYLFDRSNLDELTKLFPLLANISNSIINLLDSIKLNDQKVSLVHVDCVWYTDSDIEPFYVEFPSSGDYHYQFYCENDNWECIEVSLTTNIEYSNDIVSFVFKIVETAEKLNDIKDKIESLLMSS